MGADLWPKRWENWTDAELEKMVYSATPGTNEERFDRYARTILTHIRPTNTLDIGGGTGGLGNGWLPGRYTVMDHPRMKQFCMAKNFLPIGPIPDEGFDLVVNTSSWGETSVGVIKGYLDQIEALRIPYIYLNNRKHRQVPFDQFPLDNWEPIVNRPYYGTKFVEFLGKLRKG